MIFVTGGLGEATDKFLENLSTKFFDFFNFGRFLTIIIPGLIVSTCVAMLSSQVLFPVELKYGDENTTDIHSVVQYTKECVAPGSNTEPDAANSSTSDSGAANDAQETYYQCKVQKQVVGDFARVSRNYLPLFLLTIVLGMLLNELSYCLIKKYTAGEGAKKGKEHLHRYDKAHDHEDIPKNKFSEVLANNGQERVGIIYFAPFLKEKFSGNDNYFDFLITEYYRFMEFAMVMPVTIFVSSIFGFLYWFVFRMRNGVVFTAPVISGLTIAAVSAYAFYKIVFPKIADAYLKARLDIVKGVSDFMSKGLAGTGESSEDDG